MNQPVFEAFHNGSLKLPEKSVEFAAIPWTKHPDFKGVELKHIVTAKNTGGQFSYHLVHIAANHSISSHVHSAQIETHEVIAGSGVCHNDGTASPDPFPPPADARAGRAQAWNRSAGRPAEWHAGCLEKCRIALLLCIHAAARRGAPAHCRYKSTHRPNERHVYAWGRMAEYFPGKSIRTGCFCNRWYDSA